MSRLLHVALLAAASLLMIAAPQRFRRHISTALQLAALFCCGLAFAVLAAIASHELSHFGWTPGNSGVLLTVPLPLLPGRPWLLALCWHSRCVSAVRLDERLTVMPRELTVTPTAHNARRPCACAQGHWGNAASHT